MEEEVAQTAPNSGASNAADFQPTTQNPQNVPVNLFQQQGGVQTVTNTQELLNEQQNVRINVASEPAPERPAAAQANESPIGFILLLVLVVATALMAINRRRWRPQKSKPEQTTEAALDESPEPLETEEPEPPKTEDVPKKTKKKASKKPKRRNR